MNLQKVIVIAVIAAVLIGAYQFFTRVDRTNPAAVATAFTKALKSKNTSKASSYYVPDQAKEWRAKADASIEGMKSGQTDRYYEGLPDSPEFGTPVDVDGKKVISLADKSFSLEMVQIDGKWYVSKGGPS